MFWPRLQRPSGNSSSFWKDFTTRLIPRALRDVGKRRGQHGVCPYTSAPSSPWQLWLYMGWQPQHSGTNQRCKAEKKTLPRNSPGEGPTSCFWMDLKSSWRFLFNNNAILKLHNALSSQHILCTSDNNDLTTTLGISLEKSRSSPSTSPHCRAQGPGEETRMLGSRRRTARTRPNRRGCSCRDTPALRFALWQRREQKRTPVCTTLVWMAARMSLVFCSPGSLALEKPSLAKLACCYLHIV